MILDVDPDAGEVRLLDHDVLTRFHVAVHGRHEHDVGGVDAALRTSGGARVSGAEVLVDVDWVRAEGLAAAAAEVGADWESQFERMVEFSTARGWVEQRPAEDGETGPVPALRVHCEWPLEPKFAALDFSRTAHRERRWDAAFDRYTAPDLVAHGVGGTADLRGRAGVAAAARRRHVDGSRFEIRHVLADATMVAVHSVIAEPDAEDGRDLVDLYDVRDGAIREWWRVGAAVPAES